MLNSLMKSSNNTSKNISTSILFHGKKIYKSNATILSKNYTKLMKQLIKKKKMKRIKQLRNKLRKNRPKGKSVEDAGRRWST